MKGFGGATAILLAICTGCTGRQRRASNPSLRILPNGDQEVRAGKNLVLTCKADVSNPDLVSEIRWYSPSGDLIPQDDRVYSEPQPGDAATALFIKKLEEKDSGSYRCTAKYAANQQLEATVKISTFIGITWEDAPTEQFARLDNDYKIRCVVRANPPANIDWLKESLIISTGDQFVIESDGLLIKEVDKENSGTYTCRARVAETGELEERDIVLDVQEPPSLALEPSDVRGVEMDKAEFKCEAVGSPKPKYTWVDWEGIDATEREGWKLDETTGTLTAFHLRREDAGVYTCIAENNAGRVEAECALTVIIKPKVQELFNKTVQIDTQAAKLTCRASGDPIPKIIWRKWSNVDPFITGGQPNDDRIIVEEKVIQALDSAYTEGEREWMESSIIIDGVKRMDDGLYECMAENEGGRFFKSGHIQVEFGPTFEEQPFLKEWSWDQKPINLSCIATAIPNATVTWWYRDLEIGRQDQDKNYQVIGHGPRSELVVTPLSAKYYGHYTCKAENPLGTAYQELELEEAHEPSKLQQAILDKYTATTLQFRFVAPTDSGGLPIESYAAEYKETRQQWNDANRRVWPANQVGGYILEDLNPQTTYDLRFGCKNRVGFSNWGAGQQITTPKRGRPEPPILNKETGDGEIVDGDIIELPTPDHYQVSWRIPEDNGVPIDYYLLTYYPVRRESSGDSTIWRQIGDIKKVEIPHKGNVRWSMQLDYQDTFYKVELMAHNQLGFSPESVLIIKSGRGPTDAVTKKPGLWRKNIDSVPLGPLVGGVVAVLVLVLILVDISCYKLNQTGLTYLICKKSDTASKFDPKKEREKSSSLRGQTVTSSNGGSVVGVGFHEKEPLIDGQKNTVVTVAKNGSRSTVSVGKDSAV